MATPANTTFVTHTATGLKVDLSAVMVAAHSLARKMTYVSGYRMRIRIALREMWERVRMEITRVVFAAVKAETRTAASELFALEMSDYRTAADRSRLDVLRQMAA